MEDLLDLVSQDETEPVETEATTQPPAEVESETPAAPDVIKEIDTAPKAQVAKALPGKAVTKPAPYKREEPPPARSWQFVASSSLRFHRHISTLVETGSQGERRKVDAEKPSFSAHPIDS